MRMATIRIIRMRARLTDTGRQVISRTECSSALGPGITRIGIKATGVPATAIMGTLATIILDGATVGPETDMNSTATTATANFTVKASMAAAFTEVAVTEAATGKRL